MHFLNSYWHDSVDQCLFNMPIMKVIYQCYAFYISARNSHITQISATSDKSSINTYVLPKKPITPKAQEITGIKVEGSKMFCHDKEVKSVGIKEALKMFILFLAQYKKNIIIGHNIKSYDIPVLFCALNNCSIMNEFSCSIL